MSPPWRSELRLGLCAARLVLPDGARPVGEDAPAEIARLGTGRRVTVVLSSHFVRYALLPWSGALGSDEEWLALARHSFAATHGGAAEHWNCRVSPADHGEPRLASAIDASLLDALSGPPVVSVQPYLMSAFNARRRALAGRAGWFVLHEPGRLTLALMRQGQWRSVRTRRVSSDWQQVLPNLLDRETALARETPCEDVFFYGEAAAPPRLGRYRVSDLTPVPRATAMVFH